MIYAPWLARTIAIAEEFEGDGEGKRRVYAVLLNVKSTPGIYIGQTWLPIDERFDQHKRGYKASRHVEHYGVVPLYLVGPQLEGMSHADADRIEYELYAALKKAGIPAYGGR
jgi:hypothetical protein